MDLQIHGNIAVKPLPIRLLALGAAMSVRLRMVQRPDYVAVPGVLRCTSWRVNRLTTWQYCALACNHRSGDNCSLYKAARCLPQRSRRKYSQEINDCPSQHAP